MGAQSSQIMLSHGATDHAESSFLVVNKQGSLCFFPTVAEHHICHLTLKIMCCLCVSLMLMAVFEYDLLIVKKKLFRTVSALFLRTMANRPTA